MKSKPLLWFLVLFIAQGCAMERTATRVSDNRPCVQNYSTEGDFWVGKQFKTYQDFKVPKNIVFEKIAATISSRGYQITSANKDLGLISASQGVIMGKGKVVPLNATITGNSSGDTRAQLTFSISGGLSTSADAVQDEFCKILSGVLQ